MLVRTSLDVSIGDDRSVVDRAPWRSAHKFLARTLLDHGVIVLPGGKQDLRPLMEDLDDDLRLHWEVVLAKACIVPAAPPPPTPLAALESVTVLRGSWQSKIAVAVVSPERAVVLGLDPDQGAFTDGESGIDIVRFDLLSDSTQVAAAMGRTGADIPAGTSRDKIWRDYFHELASSFSHVLVVDGYAGHEAQRRRSRSGLAWFLDRVNSISPKCYFTLYTSFAVRGDSPFSAEELRETVRLIVAGVGHGGLKEVKLCVCQDHAFRRQTHARWISFGDYHAYSLDNGLKLFEFPELRGNFPIGRVGENTLRDFEERIRPIVQEFRIPNPP